jgi:hypothetical protein
MDGLLELAFFFFLQLVGIVLVAQRVEDDMESRSGKWKWV